MTFVAALTALTALTLTATFADPASAAFRHRATSDTTAPTAPSNLRATALTPDSAELTWSPAKDNVRVTRYTIWRGDANRDNWVQTGSVAGNVRAWTDTGLRAATTYTWALFAFDAMGNRSVASAHAQATTPAASGAAASPAPTTSPSPAPAPTSSPAPAPTSGVVSDDHSTLLRGLEGFGERTTGGQGGQTIWVTNANDSGAGSLRAAATTSGPKWIRFDPKVFPVSGGTRISLGSSIDVTGNTTIDGRGAKVIIQHHGMYIDESNVIVTNLIFDFAAEWTYFEGNAPIQIGWPAYGTKNVWVHQNTFQGKGPGQLDGALDIFRKAQDITVSWNKFLYWDKTSLLAPEPGVSGEASTRITFHHNLWDRNAQRQPLMRFGKVHAYNNWYRNWDYNGSYGEAIVSQAGAEVLSQNNLFEHTKSGYYAIITSDEGYGRGYAKDVGSYFGPGVLASTNAPERVTLNPASDYSRFTLDDVGTAGGQQALRDKISQQGGWQG